MTPVYQTKFDVDITDQMARKYSEVAVLLIAAVTYYHLAAPEIAISMTNKKQQILKSLFQSFQHSISKICLTREIIASSNRKTINNSGSSSFVNCQRLGDLSSAQNDDDLDDNGSLVVLIVVDCVYRRIVIVVVVADRHRHRHRHRHRQSVWCKVPDTMCTVFQRLQQANLVCWLGYPSYTPLHVSLAMLVIFDFKFEFGWKLVLIQLFASERCCDTLKGYYYYIHMHMLCGSSAQFNF
uniref:Uncharacterized protein n=1 Tax=Glossina austeni TaxID=7395 RepID=A0A1A9VLQ7_GLOAU